MRVMELPESARVDRWLWSVRVFPTRSAATEACRGGHVAVNRVPAKASTAVRPGDRVVVAAAGRRRELEVVQPIEHRVGAPAAAACLLDHTPPAVAAAAPIARRDPGSGRPTKKERRDLDRYRR